MLCGGYKNGFLAAHAKVAIDYDCGECGHHCVGVHVFIPEDDHVVALCCVADRLTAADRELEKVRRKLRAS